MLIILTFEKMFHKNLVYDNDPLPPSTLYLFLSYLRPKKTFLELPSSTRNNLQKKKI